VSQNADRSEVLEIVADYFGCGSIRPDPSDPLMSGKQNDVDLLATVCRMMIDKHHLRGAGLLEIAAIANQMNPSGSRRYTVTEIEASVR
jgi:hypothetical protein